MAFFRPNIQWFHHHFTIVYCHNMISCPKWESASQYLIVYLEKLLNVQDLFNIFFKMWHLIIYHRTNCPVRQTGFFFFFCLSRLVVKVKFLSPLGWRLSRSCDQTGPHPLSRRLFRSSLIVRICSQQTAVSLRWIVSLWAPCQFSLSLRKDFFGRWWLVVMCPQGSSCQTLPWCCDSTASLQQTRLNVHKVQSWRVFYEDNRICTPVHNPQLMLGIAIILLCCLICWIFL